MMQTLRNRDDLDRAINKLSKNLDGSQVLGKPVLTHSIMVGFYLMNSGYDREIVLAGFLHDIVEDSDVTIGDIKKEFGSSIGDIVARCTKSHLITDKVERRKDVIKRASEEPKSAIVKAADIIDNFKYYKDCRDKKGLKYCRDNISYMREYLPTHYQDPVFLELFSLT